MIHGIDNHPTISTTYVYSWTGQARRNPRATFSSWELKLTECQLITHIISNSFPYHFPLFRQFLFSFDWLSLYITANLVCSFRVITYRNGHLDIMTYYVKLIYPKIKTLPLSIGLPHFTQAHTRFRLPRNDCECLMVRFALIAGA